jgi:hypothetical protein
MMQNGGSGVVTYPGISYRFVNLFDCSGSQPLMAVKANVNVAPSQFLGSSSNCSGAGPLMQLFNTTYPSATLIESGTIWPGQAIVDQNGNALAPNVMGNPNGTDYLVDRSRSAGCAPTTRARGATRTPAAD